MRRRARAVYDSKDQERAGWEAVTDEAVSAGPEAKVFVVREIRAAAAAAGPTGDKKESMFKIVCQVERGRFALLGEKCGGLLKILYGVVGENEWRGH